jgi:hypothetical protein
MEDNATDFRNVIEEKLKAKKNALDQTEQNLKKYAILRDTNNAGRGGLSAVRGRLGPPTGRNKGQRPTMESRLGPKVGKAEDDEPAKEMRSVMSRVVVEQQKSRDDALAEGQQKMDKNEKQVNFLT